MKQEYRKKSAEMLGILGAAYESYQVKPGNLLWQPDKDANQMLMVWKWLRKQGFPNRKVISKRVNDITHSFWYQGEDIKLATMKAFIEYINN